MSGIGKAADEMAEVAVGSIEAPLLELLDDDTLLRSDALVAQREPLQSVAFEPKCCF